MSGHFRFALAMICCNCDSVFAAQPTCPACSSDAIYPIEKFLRRRAGRDRLHALKSA